MEKPPIGICLPCLVDEVHDGDTLYVRVVDPHSGQAQATSHHVRLLDCWAPEVTGAQKPLGLKSREALAKIVHSSVELLLFVPLTEGWSFLTLTTMGRLLGRVFADGHDVSELMVAQGFAGATKEQ